MSKLYKHYVLLKINNPNKIYLFESGIFYIFIHEDAILMSKILNLKQTNLNPEIVKCGFPVKSADKYFNILKASDYNVEIVSSNSYNSESLNNFLTTKSYDSIIDDFLKLNIDELSISQAFSYLRDFQNKFRKIKDT